MGGFFKGIGICSIRAVPVNAAGFYAFETVKNKIENYCKHWKNKILM